MIVPYKLAVLLHKIHAAGCGPVRGAGREFRCRCPAHADNGPSLYVGATQDAVLLNCKAGCTAQAVCDRLDHDLADLFLGADDPWVAVDAEYNVLNDETAPAPQAPEEEAPKADVATGDGGIRHDVYADLLGHLELSTEHFDDLRRRGLTGDEIARRCYRTADAAKINKAVDRLLARTGREGLLAVPGFREKDGRVFFPAAKGYFVPARDPAGHINALKIRHDGPAGGPKYTWASCPQASCGNPVHVPLGVPSPAEVVRLTEGELKADVSWVVGQVPTISVPGVSAWELGVPVLKDLGARRVLLAMDQDGKPGTLAATEKALYELTRAGFDAVLEWWDGSVAKGIDDLLAGGGRPEVITGLAAAVRVRDALHAPEPEGEDPPEPEPAPFPVDVFPPELAAFCREVAEATSTPPDFCGLTMLVTAAAAIGNSRAVCLKAHVWYESPRIYAANVGDPASGKTPAMDAVVKPYQVMQSRLIRQYKDQKAAYDQTQAEHDRVAKENRAASARERKPLPVVPEEPHSPERFLAVDATVESLAPLLEENPRGLLMPQDEGVGWVRGMGQYKGGRGNDRQFWLSNWSGKAHMVDRKAQGVVPIYIPRPFLNVICGLPPDMLSELADYQGRNDGFLHRILFVFPRASVGADWTEGTVSRDTKDAWARTLAGLRRLAMEELDDGVLGYRVVRFSAAAKHRWVGWWDQHAAEIRSPELPAPLVGPWGKLKAYAARLALVLHYLWLVPTDGDEGDLEEASVERAVRLVDYFKSHQRLVYARLRQTPEDNHLFEVLDWIRTRGGQCTVRDLVRAKKVGQADTAKKMLKELEERGYGRLEDRDATNHRRVTWFVFDPT
jgi:hypothetical protein